MSTIRPERGAGGAVSKGLEIADLLTIDVAAEVRKLSRAQLESPAQLPVELVRRALAAGAALADVRCDRRGVTVRDDGPALPAESLDALAALLDARGGQTDRHHALLRLEATGDLALLALAGIDVATLRVRSGGRGLVLERGKRPVLAGASGGGTTVEIGGAPLDAAAVRDAIRLACRFASAKILLDGAPLSASGFAGAIFEDSFDTRSLRGRLAFPATGDTARVWILLDGITAAHVALPGLPCFEAAVDARLIFPRGQPLPPPSALREAIEPHVPEITERALERMERAAANIDRLPAERHSRVREWVATAIRKKLRAGTMRAVRVFPVLVSHGAESRRLSLDELAALAKDSQGVVALFPEQDPSKFLLPGGAVPVLDAVERGRLAALLGVSFRSPPPRRAEGGALAGLYAALASARHDLREGFRRLLHPFEGRPIADDALSTAERAFLATLREHVMTESCEDLDVRFVEGAGPVRQVTRPSPALLLPRSSPVVRAALSRLAHDRSWIYPIALALEAIPRPATRTLFQSATRPE